MARDADGIPRYEEPTWEELNELYRDPTPAECLRDCTHRDACLRLLYAYTREEYDTKDMGQLAEAAKALECDDCAEWSD